MALITQLSVNLNANTKGLEKGFNRAKRKVKSFTDSIFNIKTAVAGALGIGGIGAMAADLISVNAEMQRLKSGLKTVTGSGENAARAFDKIKEFSVTTPFELNQVTDAFVKLKAFGLDPSDKALRAYGNTASAMGKSLNQVIEAVADAATGEFERLKEFGIRAKKQGEEVTFTFRGIEQNVKMNSESIQGYLLGLGQNEFGGAMADQMNNLTPAFSNLRTAFQNLQVGIGEAGVNQAITALVTNTTAWLESLDQSAIQKWTQGALNGFANLLDGVQSVFNWISGSSFLQYGGIIGYMLFGKLGVGIVALIDQVNTAMARDVAGIWERLNPSGVTGGQSMLDSGYQLGSFNDANGRILSDQQRREMRDKYGQDQLREQEKTNGLLSDVATILRNQSIVAVAG